jgi:predicted DNA-binding transcriptional regulator AlpA
VTKKAPEIDVTKADDGFMSSVDAEAFTGIPQVTLAKMAKRDEFPASVAISAKRKGYPRKAVIEWARETLRRGAQLRAPRRRA